MLYKNKESPSEAIIRNEKKKRKKSSEEKSLRKRGKYLPKGQTWQLCGKVSLKRRLGKEARGVWLKFASHLIKNDADQNEKNVSRRPPAPAKQNEGAVLLFPLQF